MLIAFVNEIYSGTSVQGGMGCSLAAIALQQCFDPASDVRKQTGPAAYTLGEQVRRRVHVCTFGELSSLRVRNTCFFP